MKEITMSKKLKVIKLFPFGSSYDEITVQVGVSKGSVVNIIDEFRDGGLPIPADCYLHEFSTCEILCPHESTLF